MIWASNIFFGGCPPLVSFAMGSLGFLTPFKRQALVRTLQKTIQGGFPVTLRSRLVCTVHRKGFEKESFQVLNEVTVDRGPFMNIVQLDLFTSANALGTPDTTVQGDGLIIATPTGSTAYSLAAGGSMVHPAVPAMLVTPICPHSLSFRPILIPDSVAVTVVVPTTSRYFPHVAFDGNHSLQLNAGDRIVCQMSQYPVPKMNDADTSSDGWLHM